MDTAKIRLFSNLVSNTTFEIENFGQPWKIDKLKLPYGS